MRSPQNELAKLDHAISWRHPYVCTLITHSSRPMKMQNEHVLLYKWPLQHVHLASCVALHVSLIVFIDEVFLSLEMKILNQQ